MSPSWVSQEDYLQARDIPRAVHDAYTVAYALLAGEIDPVMRQGEIELALEVLCDAPGGDPALAFEAALAAQARYRRAPEPWERDTTTANAVRLACGVTLLAEVAHRNERYAQAAVLTSTALDALEAAAGGIDELAQLVSSSKPRPEAEAATAVYAIRSAALRRARYSPQIKTWFRDRTSKILPAYMASGRSDPRGHACATQGLFEQVELRIYDHIDELRSHSDETRSDTVRGQATAPLVAMEYCRATEDLTTARQEGQTAVARLTAFGLGRHLERLDQYGYLVFD